MKLTANGIQIEVEDSGGEGRPVVLLIMGLGMQLIAWPEDFVRTLVDAGFRVVRHDNRDIGLSQGFDEAGAGNLVWQSARHRIGLQVRLPRLSTRSVVPRWRKPISMTRAMVTFPPIEETTARATGL